MTEATVWIQRRSISGKRPDQETSGVERDTVL